MKPPAETKLETVELHEDEHIVPRGSARSTWHVKVKDAWVRAPDVPGARVTQLDPAPGSVWRRRIELELAAGTALLLTESSPLFTYKTPLAHLQHGPAAERRVRRLPHHVGKGGRVQSD